MGRLAEILAGWKNYTFPSPEIEKLATKRIEICVKNECGKLKPNNVCALCGCYMPAKVRSPKSHCRMGKW